MGKGLQGPIVAGRKKGTNEYPCDGATQFPGVAKPCYVLCNDCKTSDLRWKTKLLRKKATYGTFLSNNIGKVDDALRRVQAHRLVTDSARRFLYDGVRDPNGTFAWKRATPRSVMLKTETAPLIKNILEGVTDKQKEILKKYIGRMSVRRALRQVRQKERYERYEAKVLSMYKKRGVEGVSEEVKVIWRRELDKRISDLGLSPAAVWLRPNGFEELRNVDELTKLSGWTRARASLDRERTHRKTGWNETFETRLVILQENVRSTRSGNDDLAKRFQNKQQPLPQYAKKIYERCDKVDSAIQGVLLSKTPNDLLAAEKLFSSK